MSYYFSKSKRSFVDFIDGQHPARVHAITNGDRINRSSLTNPSCLRILLTLRDRLPALLRRLLPSARVASRQDRGDTDDRASPLEPHLDSAHTRLALAHLDHLVRPPQAPHLLHHRLRARRALSRAQLARQRHPFQHVRFVA